MRRIILSILFAVGCAHASPVAKPTAPSPLWLEIVATTDTHGAVEAHRATVQTGKGPIELERGGAVLLSGYLKILRAQHPGRVLLIDSGDLFTGTLVADLSEGQITIDAMNALGYDASAVGNHEFDFGPVGPHVTPVGTEDARGALRERAKSARFPMLSANIREPGEQWSSPFTIKEIAGTKVAIVGGTTDDARTTTIADNLVGLQIRPLAVATGDAIKAARAAGATVVILTVHAGTECSKNQPLSDAAHDDVGRCDRHGEAFPLLHALAADPATRPDLALGGHTHKAVTAIIDGIPYIQAEPKGRGFAVAELEVDGTTHQPTGHFRIEPSTYTCSHNVDGGIGCPFSTSATRTWSPATYHGQPVVPDEAVKAAIAPLLDRAHQIASAPIGARSAGKLDSSYGHETALGNLIADTLRAAAHTEIGVMNSGGIRADLAAGELTFGDVFEVLPFHNKLATVELPGATIRRLVTQNLQSDRGLLNLSGLRVDGRCVAGKPAITITTDDGKPLDDARRYTVASVDFLLKGGDGFSGVGGAPVIAPDAPLLRDLLLAALKQRKAIDPKDPALYDKQNPRIRIAGRRPICRDDKTSP